MRNGFSSEKIKAIKFQSKISFDNKRMFVLRNKHEPLNKVCIGLEVVKIKDGDDDDNGGNYFSPRSPEVLDLVEY